MSVDDHQLFEDVCMRIHVVFNQWGHGIYDGISMRRIRSDVASICRTSAFQNFLQLADSMSCGDYGTSEQSLQEARSQLEKVYYDAVCYCGGEYGLLDGQDDAGMICPCPEKPPLVVQPKVPL